MPTHQGSEVHNGKHMKFYQWGHQKKYYYTTKLGGERAKAKADRQGRAIKASKYRENR